MKMTKIWINGKITSSMDTHISVLDRGFTLADGVFETMFFSHDEVEYYQYHMLRLRTACSELYIACPLNDDIMLQGIIDLMNKNDLKSGAVRITISRGCSSRGLVIPDEMKPTVVITVASVQRIRPPAKIKISSFTRNDTSPISHLKTLSYTNNIMALTEVSRHDEKCNEALMLNTKGCVCCTSSGNVFLVFGNTLVTPDLGQGCLAGIMRSVVIQTAKKNKLTVLEQQISLEDLKNADAVFITNSIVKIQKVATVQDVYYDLSNAIVNFLEKSI